MKHTVFLMIVIVSRDILRFMDRNKILHRRDQCQRYQTVACVCMGWWVGGGGSNVAYRRARDLLTWLLGK